MTDQQIEQAKSPSSMIPHALGRLGEVFSYSTMYNVPEDFQSQGPYTIALIKLEDGPIITAQLTDVNPDDVHIGMPVEMVTRKLREDGPEGQIIYGYKFRPRMSGLASL